MNLSRYPRRRYTSFQTPIEKLSRLTDALSVKFPTPAIYMKRDDMLGLTAGGNKTRKLEFLMADALEKGADSVITCGAPQSNHCRLTLAAAVREGLKCHFVLEERSSRGYDKNANGNNLLYELLGVESIRVVSEGSDVEAEMLKVANTLQAKGRQPYVIPGGGSNETGALGYVACAQEILQQAFEMGIDFEAVVLVSGSAGTHAGMLAGMIGNNAKISVVGISVSRGKETQSPKVLDLTRRLLDKLEVDVQHFSDDVIVFDEYVGPGYGVPTEGMIEAVKLVARTEAILLDPVYTGKAMAGMIELIGKGHFAGAKNLLFLHSGGTPALYAYAQDFL
ncbi:MAG: D-cysteine desulfhydrase [Synergistaceae bacterium]|jgi:D-cysteine desulfhydrase|nr:D-cysteine desulfhydrase [Synergistaceae bacterium]